MGPIWPIILENQFTNLVSFLFNSYFSNSHTFCQKEWSINSNPSIITLIGQGIGEIIVKIGQTILLIRASITQTPWIHGISRFESESSIFLSTLAPTRIEMFSFQNSIMFLQLMLDSWI